MLGSRGGIEISNPHSAVGCQIRIASGGDMLCAVTCLSYVEKQTKEQQQPILINT